MREYVSLAPFTHINVGGPARFFVEVATEDELCEAVGWARKKNIPIAVLGAGSNVLVSDAGFDGLVICMRLQNYSFSGEHMYASAGMPMARVAHVSLQQNLGGFEWAIGIPGTIGGSVYGNAGCFGGEMKDTVECVRVLEAKNNEEITVINAATCEFGYRESMFKNRKDILILGATLKLKRISDLEKQEKQTWIQHMMRERVAEQAIGEQTMGSTFKGIPITGEHIRTLHSYDARFKKEHNSCWIFENRAGALSAGFLIEQAALKGKAIGGIRVSEKHANFLVHAGAGTAEHVCMLIALIKEHVHRKFGIMLEEEIQYIGF